MRVASTSRKFTLLISPSFVLPRAPLPHPCGCVCIPLCVSLCLCVEDLNAVDCFARWKRSSTVLPVLCAGVGVTRATRGWLGVGISLYRLPPTHLANPLGDLSHNFPPCWCVSVCVMWARAGPAGALFPMLHTLVMFSAAAGA